MNAERYPSVKPLGTVNFPKQCKDDVQNGTEENKDFCNPSDATTMSIRCKTAFVDWPSWSRREGANNMKVLLVGALLCLGDPFKEDGASQWKLAQPEFCFQVGSSNHLEVRKSLNFDVRVRQAQTRWSTDDRKSATAGVGIEPFANDRKFWLVGVARNEAGIALRDESSRLGASRGIMRSMIPSRTYGGVSKRFVHTHQGGNRSHSGDDNHENYEETKEKEIVLRAVTNDVAESRKPSEETHHKHSDERDSYQPEFPNDFTVEQA